MMINNCKFFLRNSNLTTRQLLKCYHSLPRRIFKKYGPNCNAYKSNKTFRTIKLVAAASIGVCASSFVSKKTDPLLLEEHSEDEFDELFSNDYLKKDLELLNSYGPIPYLIVGCGPAAIAAYRAIRIKDPIAKIIMICEELYDPYRKAPLSSELWYLKSHALDVKINHIFYNDYYLSVEQLLKNKNGGLSLIKGKKVIKIDPVSQRVFLDDGESLIYEKCLLVPAAKSKNLPVFQDAEMDVQMDITLFQSKLKDYLRLEKLSRKTKTIVVIGGDIVGSELTAGLNEYSKSVGLNVIQIFPEPRHLSNILPEYLGTWLGNKFQNKGIHIISQAEIQSVNKNNGKIKLHLSNNEVISADHVVIAIGSEPNIDLALLSGLEVDYRLGGYKVNAELKARKNLWIAGDSVSFYDANLGRCKVNYPENIIHSGHAAGENMAGNEMPFHYESNWWSVLSSDVFCEGIGNTDATLQTIGVFLKPYPNNSEPVIDNSLTNKATTSMQINDNMINKSNNNLDSNSVSDYKKGIVFYLKDDIIVGILLWNIVTDSNIAKQIIKEHITSKEVLELAKLFQSALILNKSNDEVKSESN